MVMPRKKRRAIFIFIIILIVIAMATIFFILYKNTDMFKSNNVLFEKYINQLFDNASVIFDEEYMAEMNEVLNNSKISSDTNIEVKYTENENTDNPINNVKINIQGQDEKNNNYSYKDIKVMNNQDVLARAEYIEDSGTAGIRLNGIKQYVSTDLESEDENNIKSVNELINTNFKGLTILNKNDINTLKEKYIKIIIDNIKDANYTKQSNVSVKINENQYNTNIYSITITKEKFNNIYIQVLEQLKQEELLLNKLQEIDEKTNKFYELIKEEKTSNLKQTFIDKIENKIVEIKNSNIGNNERTISVFESNGVAISLSIDTEEKFSGIDVINNNENSFVNLLGYEKDQEDEQKNSFDLKIEKEASINNNNVKINYTTVSDGKETTNEIELKSKMEDSQINDTISISRKLENRSIDLSIETNAEVVDDFENKEQLVEDDNNVIIEKLDEEQRKNVENNLNENMQGQIDNILNVVSAENMNNILVNMNLKKAEAEEISDEGTISDVEKNRFNSDFQLFEGEKIDKERIKELINLASSNLKDIRITQYEEKSGDKVPKEYKLIIEKGVNNTELANQFIEYIEEKKDNNFTVSLEYDEETGMVSNIYIKVDTK